MISGLASGIAVVGVVIRWVVSSPEREAAAYKTGVSDEQIRCQEDIRDLRAHALEQAAEITKLRNALLRLAIASDLTVGQRHEIAQALGYTQLTPLPTEPNELPPNLKGDL